jgi:LCP family protein required for cell wall assembly
MDRINSAFSNGGADLLYRTLEYNLGVRPHHWALAHLDDFILFVNDLGGIDVPVSTPLPDDCGGIPPGVVHMDGHTALCYVRSRFSTSDFDRSRRQQEALRVIFHRFFSLDVIPFLPEWYDTYSKSIQTDLSLLDLLFYVQFAIKPVRLYCCRIVTRSFHWFRKLSMY